MQALAKANWCVGGVEIAGARMALRSHADKKVQNAAGLVSAKRQKVEPPDLRAEMSAVYSDSHHDVLENLNCNIIGNNLSVCEQPEKCQS